MIRSTLLHYRMSPLLWAIVVFLLLLNEAPDSVEAGTLSKLLRQNCTVICAMYGVVCAQKEDDIQECMNRVRLCAEECAKPEPVEYF
ncbi:unnamed protein product [Echinostoma caproni]|uniref:Uncharacterized protein n=1 Tax=Echinostoma caproni TaxID=27848 RepID=A0A183A7I2_9TREM|nr:unnamed protein product [Echinostoma caproni]